jgi:HSP20 family protein
MAKKSKKPTKLASHGLDPYWGSGFPNMDRMFDNFRKDLERSFASFPSFSYPSMPMPAMPKIMSSTCDVIDEGDKLRVKMDVPGVKKDEIDLNVTDNSIEISAQHKEHAEEKKKNFLRRERSEVSYYRALPLSEKVKSAQAKAKLTDGILDITIPKITPTSKPKKKSIRVQ